MKNKMIKRSHLSENKCREIIELFAEDLTATQIATITGVSRVTINNYLKLIRTHILKHCEERNPDLPRRVFFTNSTPLLSEQNNNNDHSTSMNPYYGFYRKNANIFVDWLFSVSQSDIVELQKMRAGNTDSKNIPVELLKYHAIADFETWRLYRIESGYSFNPKGYMDDVAVFWANTKSRLMKFRGLNKNTLLLHVKECEFRYNYRNDDINSLLLNIIYNHPLHHSKTYRV